VPGEGSPTASILFIGEGPGATEDKQGRPFVGRAGKLLDELLAAVTLKREDVFITNVVKCRPPENRDPQPDEVEACRPYLEAQIELINPRVIVTLGRHSLLRFFPEGRISKDHGRMFRWNDRILYPLYHPAAGLRSSTVMQAIREDVKRLPEAVIESLRVTSRARDDQDAGPASPPPEPEQPNSETGGDDQQQLNLF
jgi:uracil-DNA glycosylase